MLGGFIFIIQYLRQENIASFLALDAKVYPPQYRVSQETTLNRLRINPHTDIVIMDKQEMVGYISVCPVSPEIIISIVKGEAKEEEIETKILPYCKPGYYDAYLSSIVVDKSKYPQFRGKFLFHYLKKHIERLRKRGIFLDRIYAKAVSPMGRKTLLRMNFKEFRPHTFVYSCLRQGLDWFKELAQYCLWKVQYLFLEVKVKCELLGVCIFHENYILDWDTDT